MTKSLTVPLEFYHVEVIPKEGVMTLETFTKLYDEGLIVRHLPSGCYWHQNHYWEASNQVLKKRTVPIKQLYNHFINDMMVLDYTDVFNQSIQEALDG